MRGCIFPAPAILLSLSVLVYTWAWGIQSGRETNRFDPLAISTHSPNLHLMKLHDSLKSSWSPYRVMFCPQYRVSVTPAPSDCPAAPSWLVGHGGLLGSSSSRPSPNPASTLGGPCTASASADSKSCSTAQKGLGFSRDISAG